MKIQTIEIEKVIPYAGNPRKNVNAVQKVAASIKEFGWQQPIVVDKNLVVIVGHTRLMAATNLGLKSVPIVVADNLTETQVKAYRIADNRTNQEAEWDDALLKIEFEDLINSNYDLSLTAFNQDELDELLNGVDNLETVEGDDDSVPEIVSDPITVPGDIWQLGKHKLICGDSTSIEVLEKLLDGKKADLWLTDPPYNVSYEGKTKDKLKIQNDSLKDGDFHQFLIDAYSAADSVMRPGAVFYIWHASSESFNFFSAAKAVGWKVRQALVWKKNVMVMGRQDYHWIHEPCLYGWKDGAAHLWCADRKQTTVMEYDRPSISDLHPTMKPVALFEYQIKNNTNDNDIVLDSFGGSGTTLIASEKTRRIARLVELDPKYCDVIVKRWEEFTGKDAILYESGQSFKEIQSKRKT
jgi:site-specific DNA-methyltransferase (adenine-specific)